MAVDQLSKGNPDGTTLGQSITDKIAFHGVTPIAQRANAAQVVAPAGGTGAAAGAYDTSGNRDIMINLVNEMRTVLINAGLMKGSA